MQVPTHGVFERSSLPFGFDDTFGFFSSIFLYLLVPFVAMVAVK